MTSPSNHYPPYPHPPANHPTGTPPLQARPCRHARCQGSTKTFACEHAPTTQPARPGTNAPPISVQTVTGLRSTVVPVSGCVGAIFLAVPPVGVPADDERITDMTDVAATETVPAPVPVAAEPVPVRDLSEVGSGHQEHRRPVDP